jgi:hypothetical protein
MDKINKIFKMNRITLYKKNRSKASERNLVDLENLVNLV